MKFGVVSFSRNALFTKDDVLIKGVFLFSILLVKRLLDFLDSTRAEKSAKFREKSKPRKGLKIDSFYHNSTHNLSAKTIFAQRKLRKLTNRLRQMLAFGVSALFLSLFFRCPLNRRSNLMMEKGLPGV
jgi:hypothetical protein